MDIDTFEKLLVSIFACIEYHNEGTEISFRRAMVSRPCPFFHFHAVLLLCAHLRIVLFGFIGVSMAIRGWGICFHTPDSDFSIAASRRLANDFEDVPAPSGLFRL